MKDRVLSERKDEGTRERDGVREGGGQKDIKEVEKKRGGGGERDLRDH